MITEENKELQQIKTIEDGIRFCEEIIAKAEKYERLADNTDWKSFWEDIRVVADLHDREIKMAISMLTDAPNTTHLKGTQVVSSKADWTDFIIHHEIRRTEVLNWMKEPARVIDLAKKAREKLPELKQKLVEFKTDETKGTARKNGKS